MHGRYRRLPKNLDNSIADRSDLVDIVSGSATHRVDSRGPVELVGADVADKRVCERISGAIDGRGACQCELLDVRTKRSSRRQPARGRCLRQQLVTTSLAASTTYVSLPLPPLIVSAPDLPSSTLALALSVSSLATPLPVALIAPNSSNTRFSTSLGRMNDIAARTTSIPSDVSSTTMSLA